MAEGHRSRGRAEMGKKTHRQAREQDRGTQRVRLRPEVAGR